MEDYYEILDGKIINVSHREDRIPFMNRLEGPGNYVAVQKAITDKKLIAPNMAQIVSLMYMANRYLKEPEFARIIEILDKKWFWAFTGSLYVPKGRGNYQNGVIIQDSPSVNLENNVFLEKSELIRKLESGDKSVRFVPLGFKIGEQTLSQLAKNAYVIGLVGEDGAEKLAEIFGRYKYPPRVWGFNDVDEETIVVSNIRNANICDRGKYDGYYYGGNDDGYSLGML